MLHWRRNAPGEEENLSIFNVKDLFFSEARGGLSGTYCHQESNFKAIFVALKHFESSVAINHKQYTGYDKMELLINYWKTQGFGEENVGNSLWVTMGPVWSQNDSIMYKFTSYFFFLVKHLLSHILDIHNNVAYNFIWARMRDK